MIEQQSMHGCTRCPTCGVDCMFCAGCGHSLKVDECGFLNAQSYLDTLFNSIRFDGSQTTWGERLKDLRVEIDREEGWVRVERPNCIVIVKADGSLEVNPR
jgi:hypothetical protein